MGSMKDQLGDTLFRSPYPASPGYVRESETSKAAAARTGRGAGAMRMRITAFINSRPAGVTCDEIEVALGLAHQTASARVRELVLAGVIQDTGHTRATRSGSAARIYAIAERTKSI